MTSRTWMEEMRALARRCEQEFLSEAQLDEAVVRLVGQTGSPFAAIQFTVPRPASNAEATVGRAGSGDGDERSPVDLGGGWSGTLETWRSDRFGSGDTGLLEPLSGLIRAW